VDGCSDLSGGEWQKIAIARAFFRDAPVVILDEPTAALDPQAEYEIYKQFLSLCNNKSAILISHRLSSVRMVDRIFFIKDGMIVEAGTHHELMALEGEYYRLFTMQATQYDI
jgi:ABC-type multidrug transport system fused ATPase/permease subunit